MHKLDDITFGRIARGELNPGRELLTPDLGGLACDTADMRDNLWFLYGLVMGLTRPKPDVVKTINVLEIGVSDGTSTLAFLKAAHDSGSAFVTSVDIVDVPVARALVSHFNLYSRWSFCKGDSKEVMPRLGVKPDLILIDGDHTYEGAKADLEYSERVLADGGFILIHDSHLMAVDHDWSQPNGLRGKPGCGVLTWELAKTFGRLTGFVLPFGYGLSVFRRTQDCVAELDASLNDARGKGLLP